MKKVFDIPIVGSVLKTSTFQQSSVTFISTMLVGVLGAVFYIITARILGPADFGVMSVAISTMALVTSIGNLGTDTGLVNFVTRYKKKDEENNPCSSGRNHFNGNRGFFAGSTYGADRGDQLRKKRSRHL